jgi:NADH:ubiquinone oxidoreductase subunit 6 (subunit J)
LTTLFLLLSCFTIISPLYLALVLIFLALLLVFACVLFSSLFSPVSILFLLVYVGAIMVIVGYVCSVSPDYKVIISPTAKLLPCLLGAIFFFLLLFTFSITSPVESSSFLPSTYYYRIRGIELFFLLAFTLIVLLATASIAYSPSTTIRRCTS